MPLWTAGGAPEERRGVGGRKWGGLGWGGGEKAQVQGWGSKRAGLQKVAWGLGDTQGGGRKAGVRGGKVGEHVGKGG